MKSSSFRFLAATLALTLGGPLLAQDPQQAANTALQLFNAGDMKGAAAAYAQFLKDFPTAPSVSDAQFKLGYLDFLLGDYDASITFLKQVQVPPASPDTQEMSFSLVPQVLAAQASKMPAGPARVAAFNNAIAQYDVYLAKFPQGEEVESVRYSRALASYQIEKFDDAVSALRQNLAAFRGSESILDSQYLLALALSTQGNLAVRSEDAATKQSAEPKFEEAEKLLIEIIKKRADVALANDAAYQLGDVYYNRAAFATGEVQKASYQKAVAAFRLVEGRDEMVAAQQARLAGVLSRLRASAGNRQAYRQLQALQQSEQTKLATIQGKPSQTVDAAIKVGVIYFLQNDANKARVVLRQMQNFATTEDQKKQLAYYLTLTYAAQNLVEPAVKAYEEFQAKYKGDPIAENLPYVIGTLFLAPGATLDPQKANAYFQEALTIYPKSRFTKDILGAQASALLQEKRYDEALAIYQKFLATTPAPEQAAAAEAGIGDIYRNTGKIDDAITQFKKVRDTYGATPYGEQASFFVGQLLLQKGDAKNGLAELSAFATKYPQSALTPTAKYLQAAAQLAAGQKQAALDLFRAITQDFPKAEVTENAYFQMAQIYGGDQKGDEMVSLMKEFIAKYPDSKNLFFAYDSIGQTQVAASKISEAVAIYHEMAEQHAENASADAALLKAADLQRQIAESLGRFQMQSPEQRTQWTAAVSGSLADGEKLLQKYPQSANVAVALQTLLKDQQLLVEAKQATAADVEKYFTELAGKAENPGVKGKVLFALASYLYATDQAKALAQMQAAYDPQQIYAPQDLDLFGGALLAQGKAEEADALYTKLAGDYPNPVGTPANKASALVQEAQSTALFGQGSVLQKQGKIAEAAAKFDALKTLYPWSPKLLQANYGIAQGEVEAKKYDEAIPKLVAIIRAPNAPTELRANATLLSAKIQEEKGNLESAIDQYAKIAAFYQGVPQAASEGLWKAAQLLEQQAGSLTDAAKKTAQLAKAGKYYQQLAENFAESPHAAEAKQHAAQLAPAK